MIWLQRLGQTRVNQRDIHPERFGLFQRLTQGKEHLGHAILRPMRTTVNGNAGRQRPECRASAAGSGSSAPCQRGLDQRDCLIIAFQLRQDRDPASHTAARALNRATSRH